MKKILGLDLGSVSIGWALINEPESKSEKYSIQGMGVRIVPLSKEDNDEFTKGNAISKNAKRTEKRGARRGSQRYKLRRKALSECLIRLNMLPDKSLFLISALELYGLHDKALNEQISLQEIGRIFLHLNQKRGYKSNRKAQNEEEEKGIESKDANEEETIPKKEKKKGYLDLIADREKLIESKSCTIGQFFYNELKENPQYRIKENIFMRSSYVDEFNKIWDFQKQFYPEILNDINKIHIRDEIIYYHRPLKSQKGLVSVCKFEGKTYDDKKQNYEKQVFSGPKVVPKSSPLFQISKIWQELNNIEITSFQAMKSRKSDIILEKIRIGFDEYGKRKLTLSEKQNLFNKLNLGEKLTPKQILEELGYKSGYNEFKINLRNEKFMEENRTISAIKKVFEKHDIQRNDLLRFDLETEDSGNVNKETGEMFRRVKVNFEQQPLYKLWHLIYSIDEVKDLENCLVKNYGFEKDAAKDLAKIDFAKQGYGNMSARALRNILPHLMDGMDYDDACCLAGYNHSNSLTKEENQVRELIDKLELYPKNSLRQPVVEKIINHVINLINDIIDPENGFITKEERLAEDKFEIRVELARDLKQSAKERNNTFKNNSAKDKKHKEIEDRLRNELGFSRVSSNDIVRYKLWEEFGFISPYQPSKPISLAEVFNQVSGILYDIEHIIPKSRVFDDSFSNKTLCPRGMNSGVEGKNQDTAYDFMKKLGEDKFHEYIEFLKKNLYRKNGISKAKFNKLMMPADKIPHDFIDRQMQETRFISREVRTLLQKVCRNVHTTVGTVTSRLRVLWGWDDILMSLQIDKYRENGMTESIEFVKDGQVHYKERITGWSKRDDYRHHALDALCIASTSQSMIQRINSLNSEQTRKEMYDETINKNYKEKLSLLEKSLIEKKPFNTETVKNALAQILISFKAGKRVAVWSKNVIKTKQGELVKKELTPRGRLHEESVNGLISHRIGNDNIVKTSVLKYKVGYGATGFIFTGKETTEQKSKIDKKTGVETKSISQIEKALLCIVDIKVREIVRQRLTQYNMDIKKAFAKDSGPLWFNEQKGIAIRSIRCFTNLEAYVPVKKDENGNEIGFALTGNNHHIAIYKDSDSNYHENAVTFWDAFERKKAKLPVIITKPKEVWDQIINDKIINQNLIENLPEDKWEFVTSMQQNEMFVFGLTTEELENAITENNYSFISKHLFRVQKLAKNNYFFRNHLVTRVDDKYNEKKNEMLSKKLGDLIIVQSLHNMTGIKVKINKLGNITLINKKM